MMSEEQQEPRSLKEHIAHLRGPGTKMVSDDLRSADEIERLLTEGAIMREALEKISGEYISPLDGDYRFEENEDAKLLQQWAGEALIRASSKQEHVLPDQARIKLAEAMGWKRGRIDTVKVMGRPVSAQRWIDPNGNDRAHIMLPDPFTDANDDYEVLLWMRDHDLWPEFKDALDGEEPYVWYYTIGDCARAALKVIDSKQESDGD